MGRPGYNRVSIRKTILFGFMDKGYVSLWELVDRCKVNLRYMYLDGSEDTKWKGCEKMELDQLHFFTAPISSLLVAVSVIVNQTTGFYNLFFLIRHLGYVKVDLVDGIAFLIFDDISRNVLHVAL